jgi:hypothetical protein
MALLQRGHLGRRALRWGIASIVATAALTLAACGGNSGGGTGTTSIPATATPAPTPVAPAGGEFTATGTIPLGTTVTQALVTCSFPSLNGPEISLRVSTADQSMGGFITLTSSTVYLRIGAGSGTAYTQRNFAGPGVTDFNATKGATFNAHLTDVTPAGQNVGTIGVVTAISGSVSCGTKQPGGGTITITGNSTGGAISGPLTSMLVGCPVGQTFSLINGLTQVASAPASVEVGGGSGGAYFASISTNSTAYFFSSSAANLYTLGNGHVIWNHAVLTQTGTGGAGHTITVNGDATCGT